ncbi:MAG: HD domain-containing protein [archaeon]
MSKDISVLQKCIDQIQNEKLKKWTINFFEKKVPAYFFEVPASSTNKYHPGYSRVNGGTVNHTKMAINLAIDMIDDGYIDLSSIERDIVIVSLLLHDTFKYGIPKAKYTNASHGADCAAIINDMNKNNNKILKAIAGCVASHMGQFNKDYRTKKVVAPMPKTKLEKFVAMCDYLASRNYLDDISKLTV